MHHGSLLPVHGREHLGQHHLLGRHHHLLGRQHHLLVRQHHLLGMPHLLLRLWDVTP